MRPFVHDPMKATSIFVPADEKASAAEAHEFECFGDGGLLVGGEIGRRRQSLADADRLAGVDAPCHCRLDRRSIHLDFIVVTGTGI